MGDLTSQAKGTVASTFLMFLFTLFAFYVHTRHPESELPDFYCQFTLVLGYLGLVFFIFLGLGSHRFRTGLRGKLAEKGLRMKHAVEKNGKNDSDFTDIEERTLGTPSEGVSPTLSRPATAASNLSGEKSDD